MVANSSFFEMVCNGRPKVSQERRFQLHDDDPHVFAKFLQFVYCKDYEGNRVGSRTPDMRKHLTLQRLGMTGKEYLDLQPRVIIKSIEIHCMFIPRIMSLRISTIVTISKTLHKKKRSREMVVY